jgi:hypothetical protein
MKILIPILLCAIFSSSQVEDWKNQISEAFNKAESEVYNEIIPDDEPVGPNEDPAKCVCKGTGIITHGDGHTTPCPFHAKKQENPPLVKIKDFTCQCETECGCNPCKCFKMEKE